MALDGDDIKGWVSQERDINEQRVTEHFAFIHIHIEFARFYSL
jgi:hypothetical protein